VAVPEDSFFPGRNQLLEGVFPNGLKQAVSALQPRPLEQDERAHHESREEFQYVIWFDRP